MQFCPLLALPLMLFLFRPRYDGTHELVMCIVFCAPAKALGVLDARIFEATGQLVSGHSLKHLAAYFLVRMASARHPVVTVSPRPGRESMASSARR